MSELSSEMADLTSLMEVIETSLTIGPAKINAPVQLIAGDARRWELEIWCQAIVSSAGFFAVIGTNTGNLKVSFGIPAGTVGLIGKWNVRQDGIRPMLPWYGLCGPTGASVTFYIVETKAVQG